MTLYKLIAWWSKKSKAPNGKLSAGIVAADTSVNIVYRKLLCDMRINRFFQKMLHEQRSLATMKSYGLLLPLVLVLSGCQTAPIKPSISKMAEIRTILVVPVESPPLEVVPDLIETRFPVYSQYQYQAMPYTVFLEKKIYKNPGGVLIAGLVSGNDSVPAAEFRQTSASMENTVNLEPAVSLSEHWTPTLILAQEAVSQLNGGRIKAKLSKHYFRLPVATAGRNAANLGNWHNAIEQWYKQNASSVDYRKLCLDNVDAVMEVGIGNYRIFDAQTSLQVLIKLIDPDSRQVIGRISAKDFSVEAMPQTLLSHKADQFKRIMNEMGAQLVTRGFSGLGLAQSAVGQNIRPAQLQVDGLTP